MATKEEFPARCPCRTCSHLVTKIKIYTVTKQFYIDRRCEVGRFPRPDLMRSEFDCTDYLYEVGTDDEETVPRAFRCPRTDS
jgi:hypothetical protein